MGKFKKWAYSMPGLILMAIFVLILARGAWEVVGKERESAQRIVELEEGIATMEMRTTELEANLEYLETKEGQEEEIRGKFDVSKEGEHVVVIVEPKPEEPEGDATPLPWYKRLWGAIMGRQ